MNLHHIQRESKCLNCDNPLDKVKDNFCPNCGQLNNAKKESAFELIKELVGDFLHLDSKVMGTIIPLLFKPGRLTKLYNEGHRAGYLHPVRMFISIMIIYVIISGLGSSHENNEKETHYTIADSISTGIKNGLSQQDSLEREAEIDGRNKIYSSGDSTYKFNVNFEENNSFDKIRYFSEKGVVTVDALLDSLHKEKSFINRVIYTQALKLANIKKLQSGLREYLVHKLPWIIFSLMPVFAFILWLLYFRRKIMIVDHLVYAFHVHAFFFLLLSIVGLINWLIKIDLSDYASLYILIYLPLSLRKVYGQSWRKTLLKLFLLFSAYLVLGLISTFFVLAILFVLY